MKPEFTPSSTFPWHQLRKWRRFRACRSTQSRSGMAIVLSLFGISIISMVIVTFFVRTGMNRQIIFASRSDLQSELLGRVASEVILGQLREEIRLGSTRFGKNGTPSDNTPPHIYLPLSSNDLNPKSSGLASSKRGTLLKISSETPAYPGSRLLASSLPTDENRSDSGKLSQQFWYERAAMGQTNLIPRWVLMTARGVTNQWNPENKSQPLIGRFAYAIYDEGALLDLNVAGAHPNYQKKYPKEMGEKSGTVFADLTIIPGITLQTAESLLLWRNPRNLVDFESYTNYLHTAGPMNGFLDCQNGNNTFLARTDLIDYAKTHQFSDALPYLTHFSREKSSPSWYPTFNGQASSTFNHRSLFHFEYANEMDLPWNKNLISYNRNFANLRDSSGKSLLLKRFALSRIKLLTTAPSTVDKSHDIYKYFGLTRSDENSPWTYNHGCKSSSGNTLIYELHNPEFIAAKREPDFFELLQAGILSGSTGLTVNSSEASLIEGMFRTEQVDSILRPYHILKIGLNLIDQYDSDNFPTAITLKGRTYIDPITITLPDPSQDALDVTLTGQEVLPVLSEFYTTAYRPRSGSLGQNAFRDDIHAWMEFEVWSPYREATNSALLANGPQSFKIEFTSGTYVSRARKASSVWGALVSLRGSNVVFSATTNFSKPTMLNQAHLSQPSPHYLPDGGDGRAISGLHLGHVTAPENSAPLNSPTAGGANWEYNYFIFTNASLTMKYLKRGGNPASSASWIPYQTHSAMGGPTFNDPIAGVQEYALGNWRSNTNSTINFTVLTKNYGGTVGTLPLGNNYFAPPDPRTSRLGFYGVRNNSSAGDHWRLNGELNKINSEVLYRRPAGSRVYPIWPSCYSGAAAPGLIYPSYFTDNKSDSSTYYKDLDGVVRRADGNASKGIYPNDYQRDNDKQIILNRPFRSVAEMGYAYRDLPWKSLDFFSKNSGDAALLDLFCLEEEPEVVAGRVSLNTPYASIVQSLLQGATIDSEGKVFLNDNHSTPPATIAANYVKDSSTRLNRSEIATRLDNYYPETSDMNVAIKNRREAVPRALSDSMQSRTWNLMIDLVVQAGQMPPGAQTLDHFKVRGQKRYWVHLAIDRFTAEIIDQQIEPIAE